METLTILKALLKVLQKAPMTENHLVGLLRLLARNWELHWGLDFQSEQSLADHWVVDLPLGPHLVHSLEQMA